MELGRITSWVGPWLDPPLAYKGYARTTDAPVRLKIVHDLIDAFNDMVTSVVERPSKHSLCEPSGNTYDASAMAQRIAPPGKPDSSWSRTRSKPRSEPLYDLAVRSVRLISSSVATDAHSAPLTSPLADVRQSVRRFINIQQLIEQKKEIVFSGGEGGIRTHGTVTPYNGFRDRSG